MARILFDNLSSTLDVYCALAYIYYIGAVRSCGGVIMSAAITVRAVYVHSFRSQRNVKARAPRHEICIGPH